MEHPRAAYCIVPGCTNRSFSNPRLAFFELPKNMERRLEWLRLTGREDLLDIDTGPHYVCEEHFNPADIFTAPRRILTINSMPALQLPTSQEKATEDRAIQCPVSDSLRAELQAMAEIALRRIVANAEKRNMASSSSAKAPGAVSAPTPAPAVVADSIPALAPAHLARYAPSQAPAVVADSIPALASARTAASARTPASAAASVSAPTSAPALVADSIPAWAYASVAGCGPAQAPEHAAASAPTPDLAPRVYPDPFWAPAPEADTAPSPAGPAAEFAPWAPGPEADFAPWGPAPSVEFAPWAQSRAEVFVPAWLSAHSVSFSRSWVPSRTGVFVPSWAPSHSAGFGPLSVGHAAPYAHSLTSERVSYVPQWAPIRNGELNEFSIYCEYITSKMRRYSQRTRNEVEHHINILLHEADNGLFDNNQNQSDDDNIMD